MFSTNFLKEYLGAQLLEKLLLMVYLVSIQEDLIILFYKLEYSKVEVFIDPQRKWREKVASLLADVAQVDLAELLLGVHLPVFEDEVVAELAYHICLGL